MPLIETKGAASAQGFGLTLGSSGPVTYIEDVFSTWLYTGNGSTQTITTGIDLAGKGGMLWIKSRSLATNHIINDTARGAGYNLMSNSTYFQFFNTDNVSALSSTGFSVGVDSNTNGTAGATYVSWTFRKQPKFFDVVTYTGNSVVGRQIPHSLGSVPGCIIVKSTNSSDPWWVYHRSTGNTGVMILNTTNTFTSPLPNAWNNTDPTATVFTVGSAGQVNQTGQTYVAYLFAHNAGGFGLTGSDNVISCGSFTTDGSSRATINLGYEPQWLMFKGTDIASNWEVDDVMRGWSETQRLFLSANLDSTEIANNQLLYPIKPTSTGFLYDLSAVGGSTYANKTYIYIAIRRGPMKVPTSGTSVYDTETGTGAKTTNFPVDMQISANRSGGNYVAPVFDRLRGVSTNNTITSSPWLLTSSTSDELLGAVGTQAWNNTGYTALNGSTYVEWNFRRAPSFFDEVCYTGTGAASQSYNHNLGVAPELMLVKIRSASGSWAVYSSALGASTVLTLNATDAAFTSGSVFSAYWGSAAPTSSVFSVGSIGNTGGNGSTYVAYLFATCAGVSKVGSYTGTGALQTVNCGFTGGARFVLIKRTDTTGDWYVYDSARGISSGNDPYLFLNSNAAEVTGTNYVDTTSVGFQVTAAAPAGLNANGGTYIFLAIA